MDRLDRSGFDAAWLAVNTLRPRVSLAADVVAALALGGALAVALCGFYAKPHIDFFDFHETAYAISQGEWPPSYKRAPVFPILIALGGTAIESLGFTDPPPMQRAAELLNALLLPVNAILAMLLGRTWLRAVGASPQAAAWAALWFAALPLGMYCTAHLLVEPLLIATMLLTLQLSGEKRRWPAYAAAAIATMVRYDAAGLLIGLAVNDWIATRRATRPLISLALASLPLAAWSGLALARDGADERGHYVRQMLETPVFDIRWSLQSVLDACFEPARLLTPIWAALDETDLVVFARGIIVAFVVVGAGSLLRKRAPAAIAASCAAAAYLLIHAAFPFQWPRFGLPLAPLAVVACVAGIAVARRRLVTIARGSVIPDALAIAVAALATILLLGEWNGAAPAHSWSASAVAIHIVAIVAILLLAVGSLLAKRSGIVTLTSVVVAALLIRIQLREGLPALGDGRERVNEVAAAKWIAANTDPHEVVVSGMGGMLALYAPANRARFVDFSEIASTSWPDILAECRARNARLLVWHDLLDEERAHDVYARKFRAERFAGFSLDTAVSGLRLVWSASGRPNVGVWEFTP